MRIIKKLFLCALLIPSISWANDDSPQINFSYMGLRFQVPGNISAMGLVDSNDDMFILRYGDIPSKNYISFIKLENKFGCDLSVMLEAAFAEGDGKGCNYEAEHFFKSYAKNSKVKIGSAKGFSVYYSTNEAQTDAFLVVDENKVLHIDTDLLSQQEVFNLINSTYK